MQSRDYVCIIGSVWKWVTQVQKITILNFQHLQEFIGI